LDEKTLKRILSEEDFHYFIRTLTTKKEEDLTPYDHERMENIFDQITKHMENDIKRYKKDNKIQLIIACIFLAITIAAAAFNLVSFLWPSLELESIAKLSTTGINFGAVVFLIYTKEYFMRDIWKRTSNMMKISWTIGLLGNMFLAALNLVQWFNM